MGGEIRIILILCFLCIFNIHFNILKYISVIFLPRFPELVSGLNIYWSFVLRTFLRHVKVQTKKIVIIFFLIIKYHLNKNKKPGLKNNFFLNISIHSIF